MHRQRSIYSCRTYILRRYTVHFKMVMQNVQCHYAQRWRWIKLLLFAWKVSKLHTHTHTSVEWCLRNYPQTQIVWHCATKYYCVICATKIFALCNILPFLNALRQRYMCSGLRDALCVMKQPNRQYGQICNMGGLDEFTHTQEEFA